MITDLKLASEKRNSEILYSELDNRIDLLLSNYQKVDANPRSMGYLRFLLRHYGRMAHPWRACFTADTLVEINKGEIPISDIKPGMMVWSYNQNYGQFEMKHVLNSGVSKRNTTIYELSLENGKSIKTTSRHKFLTLEDNWVSLEDMKDGQIFKEARYTSLGEIRKLDKKEDVWDLEIEDNHNFVVQNIIAHNCYKDNLKRFGDKTPALCGVLKDSVRQTTFWRGKAGHSKVPDVGDPGYAIGEADKAAAPPWGGHRHLAEESSGLDMGEMAMPDEVALILEDLGSRCDVYRVLVGLDEPPESDLVII